LETSRTILVRAEKGIQWMSKAGNSLKAIKLEAQSELSKMEKLQTAEFNELFPPSDEDLIESSDQEHEDLNTEIAQAIARHSVRSSPADFPRSEGYGDYIESTRSEKSGSSSWSLLGIRELEAVQVSSHRGPPTDRPPDKPPPTLGVFAGCSKERSSTQRTCQLALFARTSHCSSSNVTPLAANAILGSHAIGQYCVRAVGTSHEVNRGLSWTPPRCGRFRVNRIRVGALCRPSSKPGS
jgi:hypothetical protein